MTEAFNDSKEVLAQATLLFHPKLGAPTRLITDASNIAVGAILEQQINNVWQPLLLQETLICRNKI